MTEPLSSTASVLAVAVCVTQSAKFLFKFFHDVGRIPDNVRQLLTALNSLHATLTALQQCGTSTNPNLRFSPRFCQRLSDCLTQLTLWSTKVAKIDTALNEQGASHHKWERKTRRSWHKIKWLIAGEQDVNRFLEIIRLYHAEFSIELLTVVMYIQCRYA